MLGPIGFLNVYLFVLFEKQSTRDRDRQTDTEREREKVLQLLVYSPNACARKNWAELVPIASSSTAVGHMSKGAVLNPSVAAQVRLQEAEPEAAAGLCQALQCGCVPLLSGLLCKNDFQCLAF